MSKKQKEEKKESIKEEKLHVTKKFVEILLKRFGETIKSVILFGEHISEESEDIDVAVILDDTIEMAPQETEKTKDETEKIAEDVSEKLSVQIFLLTEYWGYVRTCNPVIYNLMKTGIPVYDTGFFKPIKRLLELGKIPFTREQIDMLMEGAPKKIMRADTVKLLMLAEDFYYVMLNTAQAVLMLKGIEPPPPIKAAKAVRKHLVEPGLLEPKYADWLEEIVQIRKRIERKEMLEATGAFVDEWLNKSKKYLERMKSLFSSLESTKKRNADTSISR